jgi:hypothetical protein
MKSIIPIRSKNVDVLISKEQLKLINKILWGLKPFEVCFTIMVIVGFIGFIFGVIPYQIPLYSFLIRIILFPLRILIIGKKRKIEREK